MSATTAITTSSPNGTIEDTEDNNFEPLINQILDRRISANIDGRGGTGKTTLINGLQAEMKKRSLKYESLAPTNVACLLVGGTTMHKFALSNTITSLKGARGKERQLDYIFLDEVSMVSETFYKYFLALKKALPKTRFILSGDFEQCLPVKDRVSKTCDYKNSHALHDLCNGNRIQLSTCRRSNREYFDLTAPSNIPNLKKQDFENAFVGMHVCFTNIKRKEVNATMMDMHARKKSRHGKPLELKALDHDGNSQDVKLFAGTPIIARINNQGMDIWNNETYTITQIKTTKQTIVASVMDKEGKEIKSVDIPFEDFQKLFRPAYCITIHCSQGKTFDKPYSIHEWSRLDGRLKYVALSRSTSKENVNVC